MGAMVQRRRHDRLFLGKAGEFHLMAEFLARGYNVAVPEVDVGDDVLVIQFAASKLQRVQVKTSLVRKRSANFTVDFDQLTTPTEVDLWYAFCARTAERWLPCVLILRSDLHALHERVARKQHDKDAAVGFRVVYDNSFVSARIGSVALSAWFDNWTPWPVLTRG